MAYVVRAHRTHDVESNCGIMEITAMGMEFGHKKDFLYTTPRGNWQDITFHHREFMAYPDFLRLMVCHTPDVTKKIASLELLYFADVYSIRAHTSPVGLIGPDTRIGQLLGDQITRHRTRDRIILS